MTGSPEREPAGPSAEDTRSNTHPQVILAIAGVMLATLLGGLAVLTTRHQPAQSGPIPPASASELPTVSPLTSVLPPPAAVTSLTPSSTTATSALTSSR